MHDKGMTLVELAVAMLIISVVVGMAAPGFGEVSARWKLDAAAQQFVGDLHRARVEAVKRNTFVFVARTGNTTYDVRHLGARSLSEDVSFTGPDTVTFAPFGPTVTGAATFEFTLGSHVKAVTVDASGYSSVR